MIEKIAAYLPEKAGPVRARAHQKSDAPENLMGELIKDVVAITKTSVAKASDLMQIAKQDIPRRMGDVNDKVGEKAEDLVRYLDGHEIIRDSLEATTQLAKGLKAFPKFIYPVFRGMSAEEAKAVMDVLDALPLKDVNSVKRIVMVPDIAGASGKAYAIPPDPFIHLSRSQAEIGPEWARFVAIHEVGHTKDFESGLFGVFLNESMVNKTWGKPPFITDYAKTNWWEDFAESYAYYQTNPEQLKAECPEKFARLQELEELGTFEKLIDNKAFRETGRYIGEKLGGVSYLRTAVSLFTFLVGFVQAAKGIGELRQAKKTGDPQKKMEGTLDIAAGACFASKILSLPGLALDGAKHALNRAISAGEITKEQANAAVQATVGAMGSVLASIGNWIKTTILHKSRGSDKKSRESQKGAEVEPQKRGEEVTAGGMAKALCIGAGGAAGSAFGGFLGPYLGLLTGYSVAGPLGGTIGLVVGCLAGIYSGNKAGGELGSILGDFFTSKKEENGTINQSGKITEKQNGEGSPDPQLR